MQAMQMKMANLIKYTVMVSSLPVLIVYPLQKYFDKGVMLVPVLRL